MKKLIKLVSSITLITVLQLSLTAFIPLAIAQTNPNQAPAGGVSCETILNESKRTDTSAGVTLPITEIPRRQQDITVLLDESIINNGVPYSCGQIVSCLRDKYSNLYPASNQRSLIAPNVNAELKLHYGFCILSGKNGLDLLNNYATLVYQWIAGIVGSICILVIIFSGIQISIGGLSQEEVSSAKDRVTRSLIGLVVLFLSAFILYTINPIFFS